MSLWGYEMLTHPPVTFRTPPLLVYPLLLPTRTNMFLSVWIPFTSKMFSIQEVILNWFLGKRHGFHSLVYLEFLLWCVSSSTVLMAKDFPRWVALSSWLWRIRNIRLTWAVKLRNRHPEIATPITIIVTLYEMEITSHSLCGLFSLPNRASFCKCLCSRLSMISLYSFCYLNFQVNFLISRSNQGRRSFIYSSSVVE